MHEYHYPAFPVFFNLLIYFLMTLPYFYHLLSGWGVTPNGRLKFRDEKYHWAWFGFLFFLFAVFQFCEHDFYHYHRIYDEVKLIRQDVHMEHIYTWLILNLPGGFYVWRLVVWGTLAFFVYKTLRRFDTDLMAVSVTLPILAIMAICVSREGIGVGMMLYGVSYFLIPVEGKRTQSFLIALLFISCSFIFHRAMYVPILALVFMFVKLNKKLVIVSLILFPFLVGALNFMLTSFFENELANSLLSEEVIQKSSNYNFAEKRYQNANGLFSTILSAIVTVGCFSIITYKVVFRKSIQLSKPISAIYSYYYGLVYVAYLFFFQPTGNWMFSRIYGMAKLPLIIVLSYILSRKKPTFWLAVLLLYAFIRELAFNYGYKFYKWEWFT